MKIKELKIYTSKLSSQIDFYKNVIGFEIIERSDTEGVFKIGKSRLRIIKSDKFLPYHFAINIPCNKEIEALEWLKARVEILKNGNNEIQDFDFWNAKAIYFYDMDKNIVELIARKNLKNESQENFNVHSMIEVSEIGIPVSDVKSVFDSINQIAHLKKFDGEFERFCAIGDEHGLFICINKDIKDWFPTGDTAYSSEFEIKFEEDGKEYNVEFRNEEIKFISI